MKRQIAAAIGAVLCCLGPSTYGQAYGVSASALADTYYEPNQSQNTTGATYASASATNSYGASPVLGSSSASGYSENAAFYISASSTTLNTGVSSSATMTVYYHDTLTVTSSTLPVGSVAPVYVSATFTGSVSAIAAVQGSLQTVDTASSTATLRFPSYPASLLTDTNSGASCGFNNYMPGANASAGNGVQSGEGGQPINISAIDAAVQAEVGDTLTVNLTSQVYAASQAAGPLGTGEGGTGGEASASIDVTGQLTYYSPESGITITTASSSFVPGPSALPVIAGGFSLVGTAARLRRRIKPGAGPRE
jgi:hypothetical protein